MLLHDCHRSPFARGFGARTATCCHRQRPAAVELPDPEPSGSTILRDHGPRHSDVPIPSGFHGGHDGHMRIEKAPREPVPSVYIWLTRTEASEVRDTLDQMLAGERLRPHEPGSA